MSKAKNLLDNIEVWEMSNIRPKDTKLPMVIWIFPQTGKEKHSEPRIKVQQTYGEKANKDSMISVSISSTPKILSGKWKLKTEDWNALVKFIQAHKAGLLKVWNDEISPIDFAREYL
jgi:hypothetical protein